MICRFRSIMLFVFVLLTASAQAGNDHPPTVDPSLLEKIAHQEYAADVVYTDIIFTASLEYDPKAGGFFGRIVKEQQVWLRTKAAVASLGRVTVSSSKIQHLEEVHVEVLNLKGRRKKSYDQKDLEWVDHGRASRGIVHLDSEQQHAAIPSLHVGDLLYVRTVHDVKGLHGLPSLTMGDADFPILNDTYSLTLPENHDMEFSLNGDGNNDSQLQYITDFKGKNQVSSWHLQWSADYPTYEVQVTPQVVAVNGTQPPMAFAVGETWESVGNNYHQLIAERLEPSLEIKVLARDLVASCATDSQRIDILYRHLQDNTRYLGFYEGLDGIYPETAASVHKRGYGDCKGLASYMIALLKSVDIEAYPVLVRTAGMGPLDETLPNMMQFNHAIVWADVGPGGMWLDATVDHCPAGMIVPQDTASRVLLLGGTTAGLQAIPAAAWLAGKLTYTVEGSVDENCMLECSISLEGTGMAAIGQRRISEKGAGDLTRAIEKTLMPRSIGSHVVDCAAEGALWTCSIQSTAALPRTTEALFLPAILPPLPRFKDVVDPANETDRREEWSLVLPKGWVVAEDDQTFDAGAVIWHRKIWQEGDRLRLVREIIWRSDTEEVIELKDATSEILMRDSGFINVSIGSGH